MTPETQGYIDIPNVIGNYCQVPYSAAFDLAYPFTVIYHFASGTPWPTPTVFEMMGRANSTTQTAWRAAVQATFRYQSFATSIDGTALVNTDLMVSAVAGSPPGRSVYRLPPWNNVWLAWVYSGTATPGKHLHGWSSHDGVTWQDMGKQTITGTMVNLYSNSLPLNFGVVRPDVLPIAHKVFYCALRPGTAGVETPSVAAPVFEFDAKTDLVGKATNATSFVSKSGHTVNVIRAGGTQTQVVAPAPHTPDPLPTEPNQPPLSMLRDFNGTIIPRARVTRSLVEPFLSATTLPSWLQRIPDANGSGVEVLPLNGVHLVDAAHGQTGGMVWRCMAINMKEGVQTAFEVNLGAAAGGTRVYEVLWSLEGMRMSAETQDFCMGIAGAETGVELWWPRSSAADPTVEVRLRHPTNTYTTLLRVTDLSLGGNTPGCRTVGLRIRPVEGFIYLELEGEIFRAIDASAALQQGPARCYAYAVSGTVPGGTAPNVTTVVRQVRFELTTN